MKIRLAAATAAALAAPLVLPATHALASTAAPASHANITTVKDDGPGFGGGDDRFRFGDEHGYGYNDRFRFGDDRGYGYNDRFRFGDERGGDGR